MYSDNLQLMDEHGVHSKIADFIVGEPVDENGLKYQSLTLTVPLTRIVQLGTTLTVFDITNNRPVISFKPERVLTLEVDPIGWTANGVD